MKMRNSQVQRGVIVQQMEQQWSCYNQSPSGRLLGVEPDYLLYSKVPPLWTPVQNGGGNAARKIFAAGGVQGGAAVKLPCKSIVISSQSGPFIRWMI